MPRPKSFDPENALAEAMHAFWDLGFVNTSIDTLILRLKIRRQSLYDTFKDKAELYGRSIDLYANRHLALEHDALKSGSRPRDGLLKLIARWSLAAAAHHKRGCLLTHALSELSALEPALQDAVAGLNGRLESAIRFRLAQAAEAGDMHPETDTESLAAFLIAARHGMMVMSRAGAPERALRAIARELDGRIQ